MQGREDIPVHWISSIEIFAVLVSWRAWLAALVLACAAAAQSPVAETAVKSRLGSLNFRPADSLNYAAFQHFYDMEYESSILEFSQILERHPDDPDAINHLITAVLFRELYRVGALNTGDYANDSFISAAHRPADKRACDQIKSLVTKALSLEEDRLKKNAKDTAALYARGVTRAQYATYVALIEHAWFSALRNAVGARRDHEKVLELDPANVDAKLVVGTHNYVVGSLPWGVKAASSMIGLGGSKERGVEYLKQAAAGNTEVSIDAKIVLVVFLRREKRLDESLEILKSLVPEFPHNVLFAVEEGNLLRAKGQNAGAEAVYRKVWQEGRAGKFAGLHYEIAASALGDLLRGEKNYGEAAAAYEQVGTVQNPDPETTQKAQLGAGEMYDLMQRRDLAIKRYQAVVSLDAGTSLAETARKRLKEPYRGT